MLKTPKFADEFGEFARVMEDGVVIGTLNFHSLVKTLDGKDDFGCYDRARHDPFPWYPDGVYVDAQASKTTGSYGVCDTPEQFLSKFRKQLEGDPRQLCVSFCHISKESKGGWRWHKWGPYVGFGVPTCEYLAYEKEFENGVYVYSIYDVTGYC